ncbi:spore coat protein YutH [Radiobacillus kanasensis]|uniref:spore coat putative kinase YutH n=1 Tax=Radiobacillus kanasensis TaxID=2844358 RepID=UPI001E31CAA1|nr:spore coat protein YutH [Radiobacillus kanasensis]UFT98226.1 spore coat protein YutH [Radiobacillus kanasensis]
MEHILSQYVDGFDGQKTTINGYDGYKKGIDTYFIIPNENNEEVLLEQKALSDFMLVHGVDHFTTPIFSKSGYLLTLHQKKEYMVCCGRPLQGHRPEHPGTLLAHFHHLGSQYPYEPVLISSYGQWASLWTEKLAAFERIYSKQWAERPVTKFQRLFVDTFPYLIGLTENALQYLEETEKDWRYHEADRGTVCFQRYEHQLEQSVIWPHDIVYDHPARDIAEYIRPYFLQEEDDCFQLLRVFIQEYEQVKQLSIFSWRLIYARLLLPIHLFDCLEEGFSYKDTEPVYQSYHSLLMKSRVYESNLKRFFQEMGLSKEETNIPSIDW